MLLITDQAAAAALTDGEWHGDATALVVSFDLDEVVGVDDDASTLRRRARSMAVELRSASWGALGLAVHGIYERAVGTRDSSPLRRTHATMLVERLGAAIGE